MLITFLVLVRLNLKAVNMKELSELIFICVKMEMKTVNVHLEIFMLSSVMTIFISLRMVHGPVMQDIRLLQASWIMGFQNILLTNG